MAVKLYEGENLPGFWKIELVLAEGVERIVLDADGLITNIRLLAGFQFEEVEILEEAVAHTASLVENDAGEFEQLRVSFSMLKDQRVNRQFESRYKYRGLMALLHTKDDVFVAGNPDAPAYLKIRKTLGNISNTANRIDYQIECDGETINGLLATGATVEEVAIPAAPGNLRVVYGQGTDDIVILVWDDNSNNELGFEIEYRTSNTEYTLLGVNFPNTNTRTFRPEVFNYYFFRVRAYNAEGFSAWSNEAVIFYIPPPENLTLAIQGNGNALLNWNDNPDGGIQDRTEIWRSVSGAPSEYIADVPYGDETYTDTTAPPGKAVFYELKYGFEAISSARSNSVNYYFPAAPGEVSGSAVSDTQVLVTWDNQNELAVTYEVHVSETEVGGYTNEFETSDLEALLTFPAGSTRWVKIRARVDPLLSVFSAPVQVSTVVPALLVPLNVTATASASNFDRVTVSWSGANPDATGYEVQYRQQGTTVWTTTVVSAAQTVVLIFNLSPSTTYEFRVRATAGAFASAWSEIVTATTISDVALPDVYFGMAAAAAGAATIAAMTSFQTDKRNWENLAYTGAMQRFYFAYPDEWGLLARIEDQNFDEIIAGFSNYTITINSVTYRVYEFDYDTTQTAYTLSFFF